MCCVVDQGAIHYSAVERLLEKRYFAHVHCYGQHEREAENYCAVVLYLGTLREIQDDDLSDQRQDGRDAVGVDGHCGDVLAGKENGTPECLPFDDTMLLPC